jgi:uncharacterized protein YndB with AHSA1/START domain
MKRTPNTPEPIVVECDLPHAPALVWRALAERHLLGTWLLPNDLRPEVGAQFRFEHPDRQLGSRINCEVLEVEPNRILRWRQTEDGDADSAWWPVSSVVTIELTANAGGGTHLRLVHGEFMVATAAAKLTAPMALASVTPLRSTRPRKHADTICLLRRAA